MSRRTELLYVSLYLCIACGNQDNIVQVTGLLHQSVELTSKLSLPLVEEINWNFDRNQTSTKIAHFENLQPKFYNSQFSGRLELLHNGTTLQISDLRMEDSGYYTARFILSTEQKNRLAHFNLTVYEPVPDPSIGIVTKKGTSHPCNVTLHCSVPTKSSSLTYSWIYGGSVYELGDTIHILLNHSLEFQCIVGNPAGRKNISISAMCSAQDAVTKERWSYAIVFSLLLILLILCLVIWKIRRKGPLSVVENDYQVQGTANDRDHHLSAEEEEHSGGQIQQEAGMMNCERTFPTDNHTPQNFSWHKRDSHVNPPPQKFETLYTSLVGK